MKSFYKLISGIPVQAIMVALQRKQDVLVQTETPGVRELVVCSGDGREQKGAMLFPALKKMALAPMSMTDAVALCSVNLLRLDPKARCPLVMSTEPNLGYFIIVLHAGERSMVLAGEESIGVVTGEIWWVDLRENAALINNSEDDVIVLLVSARAE